MFLSVFFKEGQYRLPKLSGKQRLLQRYSWYRPGISKEEKRLLLKLDFIICFFSLVVYWLKMVDSSNLNNAYVSGMKEDINLGGNDLVHFNTMYFLGCIIFQIPCVYLFPKVRIDLLMAFMDVGWSLFTLAQYKATGYHSMMAYRFFVGVFEAGAFPGIQYILGSWYRSDELARRGSIFYIGYYLGNMTSGLLQGSIYNTLDGRGGIAGWRWMYIINTIMSLPVGIAAFFIYPGTPDRCHTVFLTKREIEIAKERLKANGNRPPTPDFSVKTFKKMLSHWHFYLFVLFAIFLNNSQSSQQSGYILWLKSLKRYSTGKVNNLSALSPGLGIAYMIVLSTFSDLTGLRALPIIFYELLNLGGAIALSLWTGDEKSKWFGFLIQHSATAVTPILYGWVNDILRGDDDNRAAILCLMNAISQATLVWIPLLVWPTTEQPRYHRGFRWVAACACVMIVLAVAVLYLQTHDEKKIYEKKSENGDSDTSEQEDLHDVEHLQHVEHLERFDEKSSV